MITIVQWLTALHAMGSDFDEDAARRFWEGSRWPNCDVMLARTRGVDFMGIRDRGWADRFQAQLEKSGG